MTTNHIEKLDPALIRPGRIDMTVPFSLATGDQLRQIFKAMYADVEADIGPARKDGISYSLPRDGSAPQTDHPIDPLEKQAQEAAAAKEYKAKISALASILTNLEFHILRLPPK